mgnify:CR=1 FL=1
MAEYVFVPTGARVSSPTELGAPLFRPAAPAPERPKEPRKAPARRRAKPKGE